MTKELTGMLKNMNGSLNISKATGILSEDQEEEDII
jgi:hypothetical protein